MCVGAKKKRRKTPTRTHKRTHTVIHNMYYSTLAIMDLDGAILPGNAASRSALWDEAAAILSGLIGGGRYGLKIRVPHALGEFWPVFVRISPLSSSSFNPGDANIRKTHTPHRLYDCVLPFAVMTFLFGGQRSFLEKARVVAKLAAEHATNLAAFAGLYKVGKTYCSR